ncbi:MAG: peptide chain release factor N(5)-glutamine methyltransferase [Candidatus Scalinduaceae bacterium]
MTNTIRNTLRWAIDTLKNSNIESPNTNAEILLAHALSCDRIELHTNPDKIINDGVISKYKTLINKRANHVPLQYITGHVEFMSLDFVVDERSLIPRQDTEILVEAALNKIKSRTPSDKTITVVDIGTGCGNIAISLATNLQNAQVYASDISRKALAVAEINARRLKVVDRVHLLHGNLFEAFDGHLDRGDIDIIVSNPPYVREVDWNKLEPEINEHEPREALVGGKDGLRFYKRIIREAPEWLRPEGFLILEVGETQAETITELIETEGHFENIEITKDLQKIDRIVSARRK